MPRFRIIRRPDPDRTWEELFEVEELCPYMSPSGECIATYWGLAAGPFGILDYAEAYVERAMEMADRFVVKEYE